ncbi:hypothetical protein [Clostridium sp. HV4-5-A1G]|nr:hypothetical protein [Clostridium sp. HV4-5-A1G]
MHNFRNLIENYISIISAISCTIKLLKEIKKLFRRKKFDIKLIKAT